MEPVSDIEEWMFSTVRIETEEKDGKQWSSTGFIFGYPIDKDKAIPFLVTNKHVIQEQVKGDLHFIKEKNNQPSLGEGLTLPIGNFEDHWFEHPDTDVDVAVMPFGRILKHIEKENEKIFYRFVSGRIIPKQAEIEDMDAMEEIIFIGYPKGLFDEKNYTPIIRKGVTATPFYIDHGGKKQFLIDASIFPGSSGSPIFLIDNNIHWSKKERKPLDSRILFLGIISDGFIFDEKNKVIKKTKDVKTKSFVKTQQFMDIGIVFKPETITEAIEAFRANKNST